MPIFKWIEEQLRKVLILEDDLLKNSVESVLQQISTLEE